MQCGCSKSVIRYQLAFSARNDFTRVGLNKAHFHFVITVCVRHLEVQRDRSLGRESRRMHGVEDAYEALLACGRVDNGSIAYQGRH